MATRKHYSREFKLETVKLVTEGGMSRAQVARDMGIDVQTLRKWLQQFTADTARVSWARAGTGRGNGALAA